MEGRTVEAAGARGLGEMAHVARGHVAEQSDDERAVRGLDHGLQRAFVDDGGRARHRPLARGGRRPLGRPHCLAGQAQDQHEGDEARHRAGPSA
jgi:hypothetical protein